MTDRPEHDPALAKRAALLTAIFVVFVFSSVLFRLALAAPPERQAATSDAQLTLVWEAWNVLQTASGNLASTGPTATSPRGAATTPAGPAALAAEEAAARAVYAMALTAQEDPGSLTKRLNSMSRRPPASVPGGLADVWRAWRVLRTTHPELAAEELTGAAIHGLAGNPADPATRYLASQDYQTAREYFEGQSYEGIGALVEPLESVIRDAGGGVFVREDFGAMIIEPFAGGPAEAAGLRRGDVILEVGGRSTEGLLQEDIVSMVKGPRGTQVELLVQGVEDSEPRKVTVTRGLVSGGSVRSDISEHGIGYIWVDRFLLTTGDEFRRTLKSLLDKGAKALILDLRGNPGGSIRGAVGVVSQFIPEGIVMYEMTNDGQRQDWPVDKDGIAHDLPLAVLVNRYSASAAEVVAGALQDTGRARLYGTQTYGKGSVQTFQELSNGTALYVTVAHWFTPKGRQIQDLGILPDVEVQPVRTVDVQLIAAYEDLMDLLTEPAPATETATK